MKPQTLVLWALVALGIASVVAFAGPVVTGALLAVALFLHLRHAGGSG